MKFSVAAEISAPEAGGCDVVVVGVCVDGVASEMVAGRPTRRRSVARGHSI